MPENEIEYHRHESGDVVQGAANRCIDPTAGAVDVLVMTPREFAEHLAAARAEGAAEVRARVEALVEKWRYKGEFGWGAWQEGYGPDQGGWILDQAASELRAALGGDS